jgi:iron complex transport system ATP-binding protein
MIGLSAEAITVRRGNKTLIEAASLGPHDRAAVDRALSSTDAGAFRTRTMQTLSGGEQARIHLARALAAETPILLADEPTAALDPKHARSIMQALRAKADAGGLVIAALHDLRLAGRWCTRIIVMNGGELVADDDAERAMTPAIMETVFGAGLADL